MDKVFETVEKVADTDAPFGVGRKWHRKGGTLRPPITVLDGKVLSSP
jgi:hypothetical protein